MSNEPITREEMYLAKAAGQDVSLPKPITRKEMFLAKMAGMEVETPATFTRLERFVNEAAVALNRGVIEPLRITENGTYTAPEGVDGYNPVTVEVVGSGGGSLPAGVYWEKDVIDCPNKYYQQWFEYKGELCCVSLTYTGEGNDCAIYKLVDGVWTTIVAQFTSHSSSPGNWCILELNGRIHFLGGSTKHNVWDGGNSVSTLNDLPSRIENCACCIHNGELLCYSYSNGNVYTWNEQTDTWTILFNIGSKVYYVPISIGGELYFMIHGGWLGNTLLKKTRVYKCESASLTSYIDLKTRSTYGMYVSYNNSLYYLSDATGGGKIEVCKYTPGVADVLIGYATGTPGKRHIAVINDKLRYVYGDNSAFTNLVMHEVTE